LLKSNVSLSNLFNTLPRTSALRHSVYRSLLTLADSNDNLDALELRKSDVERWLSEWEISEAMKASFLKSITDAFTKAEKPYVIDYPAGAAISLINLRSTAYEYSLLYVKSLPPSCQEAQAAALTAIASALRLATVLDFDPLFRLEAILAVKSHELFELLQIFVNNSLSEFKTWVSSHPETLKQYGE
jgi:translation initiation factor 3 subunit M